MIVLPDFHLQTTSRSKDTWQPEVSDSAFTAMSFLRDFNPDITVLLGDFLHFDLLSRHAADQAPLHRELKRLEHDFILAGRFLDVIDKYTKGEKVFILGNHDSRLLAYIAENPHLEGILSWEALNFSKRKNWTIVKQGTIWQYGKASFVHGWYWNMHHAKKTVMEVGNNIFYGHVHDIQTYSKPNIEQKPIIASSLGCLCDLNPEYKAGRPNRWVNAFGVFYFLPNGHFTFYVPTIINGVFVWNGKVYTPEAGEKEVMG